MATACMYLACQHWGSPISEAGWCHLARPSVPLVIWFLLCGNCSLVGISARYRDFHTSCPPHRPIHAFSPDHHFPSLLIYLPWDSQAISQNITHKFKYVLTMSSFLLHTKISKRATQNSNHWEDLCPPVLIGPPWEACKQIRAYFHILVPKNRFYYLGSRGAGR